jgi:phospholipid/cholesterol/gamma-HCH transport system ATP-binding protein
MIQSSSIPKKAVSVSVRNLSKSFGSTPVFSDISFEVKPSEIFVLMGPSGTGKSVLLQTLIGLQKADSGKVLIDGKDASEASTHQKIVTSIVFQSGALFNSMTVFDNLALYAREHQLYGPEEIERRVTRIMAILSLEKSKDKMPSELSGGMRKRAAIARALMVEPQLLLYDEPTSELDPVLSTSIAEIIATLREEFGVTSIVVTHDRELAFGIADRIGLMAQGKLLALDKPQEIRNNTHSFIQEFLNPRIDLAHPRFRNNHRNIFA